MNYNSDCQLEPCFTVTFATVTTIPLGTRIKLDIDNMLNPESIMMAQNLTITTMMKYESDEIFYKIDTSEQASDFQA
jgi:hypothetical protein